MWVLETIKEVEVEDPEIERIPVHRRGKNWQLNFVDTTTGEVFKTTNADRKIKRRNRRLYLFCKRYEPLYRERRISMFFITLTMSENKKISDVVKYLNRYIPILDYAWVREFTESQLEHIHLLAVTFRLKWEGKKLPHYLTGGLNKIWGARTEIRFVKKNPYGYLAGYLNKSKVMGYCHGRIWGCKRKPPPLKIFYPPGEEIT